MMGIIGVIGGTQLIRLPWNSGKMALCIHALWFVNDRAARGCVGILAILQQKRLN